MNSNNNNNNINNKIIDQESQGFENQTSQNKYSDFSKQSAAFSQTYERQHPYQIGICDDKIQNNFFQDMSSKQFNICQDAKQEMIEIVTIHKQQDKNQPEIQINANQDKSTQENQQQQQSDSSNKNRDYYLTQRKSYIYLNFNIQVLDLLTYIPSLKISNNISPKNIEELLFIFIGLEFCAYLFSLIFICSKKQKILIALLILFIGFKLIRTQLLCLYLESVEIFFVNQIVHVINSIIIIIIMKEKATIIGCLVLNLKTIGGALAIYFCYFKIKLVSTQGLIILIITILTFICLVQQTGVFSQKQNFIKQYLLSQIGIVYIIFCRKSKNNNNNDQGGNEGDSCDSCGSCRSCGSCGSFGD